MEEKRTLPRYPMEATAAMVMQVEEQERTYLPLTMRDVSPVGAFFAARECPPLGLEGKLEIVLRCGAMQKLIGHSRFAVRMGARVVRCTGEGFGVQFDRHFQAIEAA